MVLMVGGMFFLLGLYVLIWNEKRLRLAQAAGDWPVAIARICESRVSYARPKTDQNDVLVFSYKYDVDGVGHFGKSIDLFELEGRISVEEMKEIVGTYPPGAQVNVHYDANNPSVSVLEPRYRVAYFRNRNFGGCIMAVGIFILGCLIFG
jgi:hypothetical protein